MAAKRRLSKAECVQRGDREETPSAVLRGAIGHFLGRFDLMQIIPLALLLTVGMLFVYSTGQQVGGHHIELFHRQCVYLCCGVALWFALILFDYRWLGPLSVLFYPAAIAILTYVLFFGPERVNTHRWLDVGPVSIQPSEFGKMAVLFLVSWFLSLKKINVNKIHWIAVVAVIAGVPFALIFLEPDLGTALVLLPLVAGIMFAANLRWIYIVLFIAVAACAAPLVYMNMKNYQKERILTFLDPERDPKNRGWNAIQSEIAVGTGGKFGKGYTKGTHCRLGYLPQMVADSDFIFPVIAEETGFVGACSIIILYALLLFSILRTALLSPDYFGRYLCVGIAVILLTHVFINIGMCIRLMPVTGLPLPFISYGGTFLVAMFCYLGIVQSVYSHRNDPSRLDV